MYKNVRHAFIQMIVLFDFLMRMTILHSLSHITLYLKVWSDHSWNIFDHRNSKGREILSYTTATTTNLIPFRHWINSGKRVLVSHKAQSKEMIA